MEHFFLYIVKDIHKSPNPNTLQDVVRSVNGKDWL